ncbi:MAG: two-component system response regulator [Cyanobacteria bacterium SW_4_48_29]|nr:MAG: two-component system response regulator [Cyanobacteria bacterium QS_9_48_30]PSP28635.1 MAG: two-component system response regulator [Cyanobacteria bacterium SW_4_48_29]
MLSNQQAELKVLVADDHELTRLSLKFSLSKQRNIALVGLASNGREAIDLVERHHPEVLILDLQMPVMDGLSASTLVKKMEPDTQILAYSSAVEDSQTMPITETVSIDGFCHKDAPTEELVELVHQLGERSLNGTT